MGKVATRPEPPQFPILLQDVKQFKETVGSSKRLLKLVNDLVRAFDSVEQSGSHHSPPVIREYKGWIRTAEEFASRMEREYPLYRDMVLPFVTGVRQIQYGVNLMGHALLSRWKILTVVPHGLSNKTDSLQSLLYTLCQFPSITRNFPTSLDIADELLKTDTRRHLEHIASLSQQGSDVDVVRKLLSCALLHAKNHLSVTLNLDDSTANFLSHLFHIYIGLWQRAEEERRQKSEEEASLYKYKSQVHGDSQTQEERDQKEIKEQFPCFDEEFDDIMVGFTLDDQLPEKMTKTSSQDGDTEMEADLTFNLTVKEMNDVCDIHQMAFTKLTSNDWHQRAAASVEQELFYVEPLLVGYQLAAQTCKDLCTSLDTRTDTKILGSHLVVSQVLQDTVSEESDRQWKSKAKAYDVYRDANVPEAVKCRPLLDRMRERVCTLLEEWSDHPTLKQLLEIIDRVLGFSVTSPLMRFVTGLEMLLQKAEEWERNAARHVSIADHTGALTAQVIEWRKLELRCWQSCLDTVLEQHQSDASKWWFHLYQSLETLLKPSQLEDSVDDKSRPTEGLEAESLTEGKNQVDVLIDALQQFMEGSTIGQYTTRLGMIEAFHFQLCHLNKSDEQVKLRNILWNLHQHYSQFVTSIQAEIARLRAPIEKQLKGFVKIARWNDFNYYSVKQAVERTHRTLHKYSKEFKGVLAQLVKPLLTEDVKPDWSNANQNEAGHEPIGSLDVMLFVEPEKEIESCDDVTSGDLQQRLPTLVTRFRKHCQRLMGASDFTKLSIALNQFTGDVIENVHELQVLQVDHIEDKDKQRSEVRHIHQRKRRALSDLFKYLQTLGLSHRKGLTALNMGKTGMERWIVIPPLEVSTGLQISPNRCDDETLTRWRGCDMYYRRCVSRRLMLHVALVTPAKELGVGNIDRCKGFSEHLIQLLIAQRTTLSEVFTAFIQLRRHSSSLRRLQDESPCPQATTYKWLTTLKKLCDQSQLGLEQVVIVLQCCPKQATDGSTGLCSPLPPHRDCPVFSQDQGQKDIINQLQVNLSRVKDIKSEADSLLRSNIIVTSSTIQTLEDSFTTLRHVSTSLTEIEPMFTVPGTASLHPLADAIVLIRSCLSEECVAFSIWLSSVTVETEIDSGAGCRDISNVPDTGHPDLTTFGTRVDALITELLLIVQKFVQRQNDEEEEEQKKREDMKDDQDQGQGQGQDLDEKEEDEEDDLEIIEGHVTARMHRNLQERVADLKVKKIVDLLTELLSLISNWSDQKTSYPTCLAACRLFSRCCPLVMQYQHFVQSVLTEYLASHRTQAKMLSVLLAVFSELVQKGFCLPEGYSDEATGEGADEFVDTEQGGLGEGQGVKDVSDQIETEDQLEDTKKQGEEPKEKDDHKDEPDIAPEDDGVEMSEDFDGKMHDLEGEEGEEGSESEKEEDIDREMGDLEGAEADKLDEQIWGSDDDDEAGQDDKEESGPGAGQQTETELVAKDDNEDKSQNPDEKEKKPNDDNKLDRKLEDMDEAEYDENEADPHYDGGPQQEPPEALDLPDDLNLDEGEKGDNCEDEGDNQDEDNDHDIDKMLEDNDKDAETQDTDKEELPTNEDGSKDDLPDDPDNDNQQDEPNEGQGQTEPMDTEEDDDAQQAANQNEGFDAMDKDTEEKKSDEGEKPAEETEEEKEVLGSGKTEHDSTNAQQSDAAQNSAGENNQEQQTEGTGMAETEQDKGHEGQDSSSVTRGSSKNDKTQQSQRRPGESSVNRTTGSADDAIQRRLKTVDTENQGKDDNNKPPEKSDLYEHIKEAESGHDAQTLDVATESQQQQAIPSQEEDVTEELKPEDELQADDHDSAMEEVQTETLQPEKLKKPGSKSDKDGQIEGQVDMDTDEQVTVDGQRVETSGVERGIDSSIHTDMELYLSMTTDVDLEKLRLELERDLSMRMNTVVANPQQELAAQEAWTRYETLTSGLSQELCEQLRLVLEPTQASKLRGDYRTGKRLNMRKVIPYIASQFRKDKIWLRRTKPSKRQYQVMIAVDDSSSMDDNHSKQLAFESLAVIANALSLLEVGELAISSFGESVKLLHSFEDQFTSQSGARILQQFTFEQKKTKIAQLLNDMSAIMMDARGRQRGNQAPAETSQLLLVVSDGRGLFLEGMEVVKAAVRRARESNVFLVFVVIDNPVNRDSILDIKVPVFRGAGQLPEIKSYMDHFPFPFYIILRDIGSLPHTLSDALRQWFELVTATDR